VVAWGANAVRLGGDWSSSGDQKGETLWPPEHSEFPSNYTGSSLARIIHQELADVVYLFEISYDFAVEFQNPRIQRPHPP
jgi:hypothetical protein